MAEVRVVFLKEYFIDRDGAPCKPGDVVKVRAEDAQTLISKEVAVLNSDFREDMLPGYKQKKQKGEPENKEPENKEPENKQSENKEPENKEPEQTDKKNAKAV